MTPDDELLMAYADGELDPIAVKRVERAIAADPALAEKVEAHRALRRRLGMAYAPLLDAPLPDNLAAMLKTDVLPFAPRNTAAPRSRRWLSGLAVAASLVVGIVLGTQWQNSERLVRTSGNTLIASGSLAHSLETQLASEQGSTRIVVSFRSRGGGFCRVFAAPALDGIACRSGSTWQLRQTRATVLQTGATYRQASSGDASLMGVAQEMMMGQPLDEAAETRARASGW